MQTIHMYLDEVWPGSSNLPGMESGRKLAGCRGLGYKPASIEIEENKVLEGIRKKAEKDAKEAAEMSGSQSNQ